MVLLLLVKADSFIIMTKNADKAEKIYISFCHVVLKDAELSNKMF